LVDIIQSDPKLEVVGTARDGRDGVQKIVELKPDVVTLDVEMPDVDGLGALQELRRRKIRLPVVMFSALTERGGRKTLEALSLGASDYVTKPDSAKNLAESSNRIRSVLLPKLRALGERRRGGGAPPAPARPPAGRAPVRGPVPAPGRPAATPAGNAAQPVAPPVGGRRPEAGRVDALLIGISTGGPNALQELFKTLQVDVPVAIVQHMPPTFTRLLAERLNTLSPMEVVEGQAGMEMRRGRVIIAPGDYHIEFERKGAGIHIRTTQDAPENSCRPAVDVMFRSGQSIWGANILSVVMTGMGSDGMLGVEPIHAAGGRVLIQDEESSVVWGMPGAVHQRGLADKVVPLPQMAKEIMSTIQRLNARAKRTA
ncbi:MAG: chemotaxis-specific protein-glutamate methyltransferase CheB, partial [Planctomycetota bacterium]